MLLVAYSGSSMHPTLREPALLEVVPYAGLPPRVGDVVYFLAPPADRPFVHRIIRVTPAGLTTRGDNNDRDDAFLLQPDSILGQVVAAWQGRKRKRVAGGLAGRLSEPGLRCRRGIRRGAISLLDPLYLALSHWGLIARVLPSACRLRSVAFRHCGRDRFRLLLGSRVVGRYDDQRQQWLIRRPYHLLVETRALPTPPAREGTATSPFTGDGVP